MENKHINFINQYIKASQNIIGFDDSQVSDGYHTFAELYEFRKMYNAALFNEWAKQGKYDVHKSWYHNDGEPCFGKPNKWFIVVAVLPTGQISNHYKLADWDLFQIPETSKAKYPFDRHSPKDVLDRLKSVLHTDKFLSHCNEFVNQQLGDKSNNQVNSWYLKDEIFGFLKHNNYSNEIAGELSQLFADNFNLAFKKGFESARYKLIYAVKHETASVSERMEMIKEILNINQNGKN